MNSAQKDKSDNRLSIAENKQGRKGTSLPAVPLFQRKQITQKLEEKDEDPLQGKFTMGPKALETGNGLTHKWQQGLQGKASRPDNSFTIQRFTEHQVRARAAEVQDWVTAKIDVRAWEIGQALNRADGKANWDQAKSEIEQAWQLFQKIESGDLLTPDEWDLMKKGLSQEEYQRAIAKVPPEYAKITQFSQVNLVDLGGPGTGHQAAVLKLIESIAKVGYRGSVVLSYNSKKTRIYANRLGKRTELEDPQQSYNLYHNEWEGIFPGKTPLRISCRPHGDTGIVMKDTEKRVFGTLQELWKVAWPGATPPPFNDPAPLAKYGPVKADWDTRKTWAGNNATLRDKQQAFRDNINKLETGATEVEVGALRPLQQPLKPGAKTLTAFGAMDMHAATEQEANEPDFKETYFQKHWLEKLKEMTGESDPVTIILQPFLWSKGHQMQVRGGGKPIVDIAGKISAAGGKASYGWKAPESQGDAAIVSGQPPIPKAILSDAMAKGIHLVSAYYGGSVSNIGYTDLMKVLVKVFKLVSDHKPVVIALLGDEDMEAHKTAARDINDIDVVAKLDANPQAFKIQLAHIGRTQAMAQFQRYSELFVTEGANTWQELLTIGTPSLSAGPGGGTQPWNEGPSGGDADRAKDMVKSVSEALITAKDEVGDASIQKIAEFIRDIRKNNGIIGKYFNDWSALMQKSESDQVITALRNLPEM